MSSLDDSFDIEASYQREGEMEADHDPYKISYNEEGNEKCLQKITEIEKTQNDHYKTAKFPFVPSWLSFLASSQQSLLL